MAKTLTSQDTLNSIVDLIARAAVLAEADEVEDWSPGWRALADVRQLPFAWTERVFEVPMRAGFPASPGDLEEQKLK